MQNHPVAAVVLAPLSHFLLDAIPHYGGLSDKELRSRKFFLILFIDATLAVVSTLYIASLWPHIALLVVVCAFLAASPDLMWIYYQYSGRKYLDVHLIPKFHHWIQWSQTNQGLIVEVSWFVLIFGGLVLAGLS